MNFAENKKLATRPVCQVLHKKRVGGLMRRRRRKELKEAYSRIQLLEAAKDSLRNSLRWLTAGFGLSGSFVS